MVSYLLPAQHYHQPRNVMGITFPNPVGIAAGLDKNAQYLDGLRLLGPGFIEVGTITPQSFSGHPKPRLFRLPNAQAIINRMGLPNEGIEAIIPRLKKKRDFVLGINIAKQPDSKQLDDIIADYQTGFKTLHHYADYMTINISCPNETGSENLALDPLFHALKETQAAKERYVPLVIKLSPDLSDLELHQVGEKLLTHEIDGVIATNTTKKRPGIDNEPHAKQAGGLSGAPLFERSTQVVAQLSQQLQNKIPIIALGGILSGDDAKKKFEAGASLVQIYTGLIYQGPRLIQDIISTGCH